jgi:hypothetical protein
MRHPARLAPLLLTLVLATTAACGGGDDGGGTPKADDTPRVALTLPPGELSDAVVQPDEVPDGVVPLLAQTGPADIAKIASFSADPKVAETSLVEHGFAAAYVATYGDEASGRIVISVVTRFASEKGATDDLTADLAASAGTPVTVDDLGDQAGGVRAALHADTGKGELVTLRWRRGATTYLLAVGAEGKIDDDAVITLAKKVDTRAS